MVRPPVKDVTIRFSGYRRMLRVLARCRRFAHNLKKTPNARLKDPTLTLAEINSTETVLLQLSQERCFQKEIDCLKGIRRSHGKAHSYNGIHFWTQISCSEFRRIELPTNQRHPIILHRKDHLTGLIGWQTHQDAMHVGPTDYST